MSFWQNSRAQRLAQTAWNNEYFRLVCALMLATGDAVNRCILYFTAVLTFPVTYQWSDKNIETNFDKPENIVGLTVFGLFSLWMMVTTTCLYYPRILKHWEKTSPITTLPNNLSDEENSDEKIDAPLIPKSPPSSSRITSPTELLAESEEKPSYFKTKIVPTWGGLYKMYVTTLTLIALLNPASQIAAYIFGAYCFAGSFYTFYVLSQENNKAPPAHVETKILSVFLTLAFLFSSASTYFLSVVKIPKTFEWRDHAIIDTSIEPPTININDGWDIAQFFFYGASSFMLVYSSWFIFYPLILKSLVSDISPSLKEKIISIPGCINRGFANGGSFGGVIILLTALSTHDKTSLLTGGYIAFAVAFIANFIALYCLTPSDEKTVENNKPTAARDVSDDQDKERGKFIPETSDNPNGAYQAAPF